MTIQCFKITAISLLLMALCTIGMPCFASDKQKPDSLTMQLTTVEVIRSRYPNAEVIPSQRLDGKRLQQLNSHSVADAIRYFAGVQLKDYGGVGGIKTIDIRSMGTNHMGIFYDGIQLGNAQNGQIDLGKYSLDNIEEISLYNGQKSEIFQSAKDFGSAGTVYLRTRRPRFSRAKGYNLDVTFRTGSFGLANPSIRWEQRITDRVNFSVNAEYTYATGKYKFRYKKTFSDGTLAWDTTATRQNGDLHALRLEGTINGTLDGGRWNAKVYYYDSERGIPGAIVNNVWKNAQRQWDRNFFAQGTFQKEFTSRYALMANAKYARDYMHYLNPDTTLYRTDNEFWQHELYASVVNKVKIIEDWDISLATDYQYNTLSSNMVNFSSPTRHTGLVALATAYAIGGFKAQASALATFVSDVAQVRSGSTTFADRTKNFKKLTPAVFLSYRPWTEHELSFRAFYKNIFRMPTFNDLYYTDIGNAELRPEYATQYNVGVVYNRAFNHPVFRAIALTADGYYNLVTDKIIAVPKGSGQYRWMMMNIGKVHIRGLDVTAKLACAISQVTLEGALNYTFQKAQDYSDPTDCLDEAGTYRGQIAYIPWHSGSATLHGAWRALDVNYSCIYVGERYHNSSNIRANYEQPWYTHDLSASYAFKIGNTNLKLMAEVNNIFNQQYDVIQNYPMPGRNYKFVIKFTL